MAECRLIEGLTALSAQLLLLTIVLLSLFYKRHRESPRRPVIVFCMDVSKQLVSSAAAHVIAIIIAIITQGQHAKNGSSVTSECSWYFVIYSVDSTLGMVLVLIAHEVCLNMARARINGASQQHDTRGTDLEVFNSNSNSIGNQNRSARRRKSMCGESSSEYQWVFEYISDCGSYGDPPDFYKWAVQITQFTMCVIAARICCGVMVITCSGALAIIATALDSCFKGHPTELLLFVMVVFPVTMNTVQAWIQDTFLKTRAPEANRRADSQSPELAGMEELLRPVSWPVDS